MVEFWYGYVKPKYGEIWFHCINKNRWYLKRHCRRCWETIQRPLSKENNKKVIVLMKDELGGIILTKFVGLRVKTYSYLIDIVCWVVWTSPWENSFPLSPPSLGKAPWKKFFFWLPSNFNNSSNLQFLSISMSLCRFLQILERT